MTQDEDLTVCINMLSETEDALADATDKIEQARAMLREHIQDWRSEGYTWKRIKTSLVWEAFRLLGGR